MSSFADFLVSLRDAAKADEDLQSFAAATCGKPLQVKIAYKKRLEVNIKDLPILLITRPESTRRWIVGARDSGNTVRIYGLLHQPDAEQGNLDLIRFEEALDDFIDRFSQTEVTGMTDMYPSESINDEGVFAPVYAFVEEVEVKFRR